MNNLHPLIHPRNIDGTVAIGKIIRTVRANDARFKWSGKLYPQELKQDFEKQVIDVYNLANHVHQDDRRKEINPLTGRQFPFTEHTTSVASILANLGYDYSTVAAGLGHDLKDKHPEFDLEKLIFNSLNWSHDPSVYFIISGCTDYKSESWGVPLTKLQQKENAMIDSFAHILANPRIIPVKGADRLHNLLSVSEHKPDARARIEYDTLKFILPMVEGVDTVLHSAIKSQLNLSSKREKEIISSREHVKAAGIVIHHYAEIRSQEGNSEYIRNFMPMIDAFRLEMDNSMRKINFLVGGSMATSVYGPLKSINMPNPPQFELDYKGVYFDRTMNQFIRMAEERATLGVLNKYFTIDRNSPIELHRSELSEIFPHTKKGRVRTVSGENLVYYSIDVQDDLTNIEDSLAPFLGMKPMVVYEMEFTKESIGCCNGNFNDSNGKGSKSGLRLIYDTGGHIDTIIHQEDEKRHNLEGVRVPENPFIIVDLIGAYR